MVESVCLKCEIQSYCLSILLHHFGHRLEYSSSIESLQSVNIKFCSSITLAGSHRYPDGKEETNKLA